MISTPHSETVHFFLPIFFNEGFAADSVNDKVNLKTNSFVLNMLDGGIVTSRR
jgi:hypothetical protein